MIGRLKLRKTDGVGKLLDGCHFCVTGNNFNQDVKKSQNGEIVLDNLLVGEYTTEKNALWIFSEYSDI